jgi:hypothetical protein
VAYVQQQGPQFIERHDAIPLVLGCAVGQISEHQIDWPRWSVGCQGNRRSRGPPIGFSVRLLKSLVGFRFECKVLKITPN